MGKNEVLEKIRKLLCLGESDNPHEAALALQRAGALMEKYNISALEVHTKEELTSVHEIFITGTGAYRSWEGSLCVVLCRAFDCKPIKLGKHTNWRLSVIGSTHDTEIVQYFHKYLRRFISKTADVKGFTKVREKNTFGHAAVSIIGDRLREMYKGREKAMTTDSRALVVVKSQEVDKLFNQQYPRARKGNRPRVNGTREAWMAGEEAGRKATLNKPLSKGGTTTAQLT